MCMCTALWGVVCVPSWGTVGWCTVRYSVVWVGCSVVQCTLYGLQYTTVQSVCCSPFWCVVYGQYMFIYNKDGFLLVMVITNTPVKQKNC